MYTRYFELFFDIRLNSQNFTDFCEKLLKCSESRNLYLQKDMNYFQNTYILSAFDEPDHYKINNDDCDGMKKLISKIGKNSKIISCEYEFNDFIIELFKNYKTSIFKIGCNTLFYKTNTNKTNFFDVFFSIFSPQIVISKKNLTHYLNLKRLCIPNVDFKNPSILKQKIYSDKSESKFYVADRFSKENISRLNMGNLLKFEYHTGTVKEKFILLKSLIEVNSRENLPTNTIKKIIDNINYHDYIETFNYYYYNLICNYPKIEDFKSRKFKTLEESLSYAIDLELNNIRGYLLKLRNHYYICYQGEREIEPSGNIENNKLKVKKEIKRFISDNFILEDYTLEQLINIQIFNNKPFLDTDNSIYQINPVPLKLLLNKGINMYNITGRLLDFENKEYLEYDRSNFNLDKEIEIELVEKIDTYYSIIINFEGVYINYDKDFYIPEKVEEFKKGIVEAIKKGYLISDFGLVRYVTTSELMIEDIKLPCWFHSETDEEFLFLMNFFKEI